MTLGHFGTSYACLAKGLGKVANHGLDRIDDVPFPQVKVNEPVADSWPGRSCRNCHFHPLDIPCEDCYTCLYDPHFWDEGHEAALLYLYYYHRCICSRIDPLGHSRLSVFLWILLGLFGELGLLF